MADLYIGSQGSGKSARAVSEIVKGLETYTKIYTNIDVKKHEKIEKLRFREFIDSYIRPLYTIYKEDELYGDENFIKDLIELMELDLSYNEFSLLVVVDEASNYLKEKNEVYRWFIEYHRHLNIDLILITQLFTSIHLDNRIYVNIYEAFAKSRQVIPYVFIYKHYLGSKNDKTHYRGLTFLLKSKKYLDFYVSGRNVKQKNVIAFPLFLMFTVLSLVIFGFKYFFANNSFAIKEPPPPPETYYKHVENRVTEVKTEDNNSTYRDIFDYFVDNNKGYLSCGNGKNIPLVLVPKDTVLIEQHGYNFSRYYYSYQLSFCKIEEKRESLVAVGMQNAKENL
jgi:zona occludens toxin (predicted ATPase)